VFNAKGKRLRKLSVIAKDCNHQPPPVIRRAMVDAKMRVKKDRESLWDF